MGDVHPQTYPEAKAAMVQSAAAQLCLLDLCWPTNLLTYVNTSTISPS